MLAPMKYLAQNSDQALGFINFGQAPRAFTAGSFRRGYQQHIKSVARGEFEPPTPTTTRRTPQTMPGKRLGELRELLRNNPNAPVEPHLGKLEAYLDKKLQRLQKLASAPGTRESIQGLRLFKRLCADFHRISHPVFEAQLLKADQLILAGVDKVRYPQAV